MRNIPLIFLLFAACQLSSANDGTDADPPPDGPDPLLANYQNDVRDAQASLGLPQSWTNWMLERKNRWAYAYLIGAHGQTDWRVEVRYEAPVVYDPPWTSEAEHFAALKRMAELQFPGWTFDFGTGFADPDVTAFLGHQGSSFASGDRIYLHWEGIFAHEFGHALGLRHHYCGDDLNAPCPDEDPPGEGPCLMSRDSPSWGPTEQFLLRIGPPADQSELDKAIRELNRRYPSNWVAPPEGA